MDVSHIKTWRERVAHLDKPTDFAERWAAIDEANELRRFIAALPSAAAQAPMAWARPDVAERLSSPLAIGVLTELMKKQKDGYVPIYAAPVAPAAAAPKMVAGCCGRSECGGECGNEWRGMVPAQPGERAAFEAQWNVFLASGEHESDAYLMGWKVWQAARATAPRAMLTDEQILSAFELSGVEFQEVYSTTLKKWLPLTKGTQNANRLISAVRAMLGAQPPRIPIYQIGAPGIAGHHVVWWDVTKEEYERQKAAGSMRTGIVYREPSCS